VVTTLTRFFKTGLAPKLPPTPAQEQAQAAEIGALIDAHLRGDPRAFGEFVVRYQVRLLNFVYRMIGDRDRAEDLVQEAFLRVHRHLDRFDRSRKFSTWIYTIASNLAKNELRNRRRLPLLILEQFRGPQAREDRPLDREDPGNRPDEVFRRGQLQELVDRTVARLPPRHREVFVLRELEGKSYEEIAEIMRCNLGTVKSRLNRARQAFAELIGPHLD
jgi:RNA polymerase sigma-70 factor (ECF subfamily)